MQRRTRLGHASHNGLPANRPTTGVYQAGGCSLLPLNPPPVNRLLQLDDDANCVVTTHAGIRDQQAALGMMHRHGTGTQYPVHGSMSQLARTPAHGGGRTLSYRVIRGTGAAGHIGNHRECIPIEPGLRSLSISDDTGSVVTLSSYSPRLSLTLLFLDLCGAV